MRPQIMKRSWQWPVLSSLVLLPETAHAFLGGFCLPKTFWLLLLLTTGPTVLLAELGPTSWGQFIDNHLYLSALIGATIEIFIVWSIVRIGEVILKRPSQPFKKRASTVAACVFVIFLIALVLFTLADAKFGIITHC